VDKAVSEIDTAIKLNPQNADYQEIKGQICEQNHQQKEALAAYDQAIELDADKEKRYEDKMAACKRFGNFSEYFRTRRKLLLYRGVQKQLHL
jgi:tetratricopeptide (TPR) repeat protein